MTATHNSNFTTRIDVLYLAFELGDRDWKLAFTIGLGQKPRMRSMPARDLPRLQAEIAKAKKRFQLPAEAPVRSCYEAGRDGFWLHRQLTASGVVNSVVDSSSIEVNRRQRRAKTDRLDAAKLLNLLLRYYAGETKVWSIVRVPSVAAEDARLQSMMVVPRPVRHRLGAQPQTRIQEEGQQAGQPQAEQTSPPIGHALLRRPFVGQWGNNIM
jgi:transposase